MADTARKPDAVRQQAYDWLAVMNSDSVTPDERARFAAWLDADPRHRRAYRDVDSLWQDIPRLTDLEALEDVAGADVEPPGPGARLAAAWRRGARGMLPRPALVSAAVLAAMLVVTGVALWRPGGPTAPEPTRVATGVAEIRDVGLPDGSVVTLGALSDMQVRFSDTERRVTLVDGEAFFAVERQPGRPFIVAAGDTLVRVVGTKFDVHRGRRQVRVAVLEGVVEVTRPDVARARHLDVVLETTHVLTAGQQLVAERGGMTATVRDTPLARPGAWRDGRLVYDNASLVEVVADARRYFAGEILFSPEDLAGLTVTASYRTDQIDQMIDSLAVTHPIHIDRRANGDVVLTRRTGDG